MTTPMRLERTLPGILDELSAGPTPEYLDDVFVRTARTRQRPAWTFPERWFPMDLATRAAPAARLPWRQLGILALIAALLAIALAVFAGSQRRIPAPFGPARNGLIPYASNGDIYLGDPITGQTRLLVKTPETESGAVVSLDGTKVAFARDVAGTALTDVFVVDIDGSGAHKITPTALNALRWGGWTPDGRLALIHEVNATGDKCPIGFTSCAANRLDLVAADGSGRVETVATERGLDYVLFRPPDGHELLYRALVGGTWGLFAVDSRGAGARAVVPPTVPGEMDATFATAAYSADGSRIFFNEYTEDASFGEPGCCQLFAVNADGSDLQKFIPNTGGTWDGNAVVSPDGKWLAFWHILPDQTTHRVTVIRSDGSGEPIETGPDLSGTAHWIWAPDSSAILMFADDAETGTAYLLDPAGGPGKALPWTSTGDLDWQRLAP